MSDVIEALLRAHVQHELAKWRGAGLVRTLETEVGELFRWLDDVKLDEVATRAQIMGVIERHVIEPRVGGGIAELAGEMSRAVFSSPASAETRIDEILPAASYDEFAAKVVALDGVWRELISLTTASTAFADISARVAARALSDLLLQPATTPSDRGAPLAARLASRLLPGLAERLRRALSRYLERRPERFARDSEKHLFEQLDAKRLRAVLDEVWDAVAGMRLADAFAFIDEHDLEDFIVLGYEFWLNYRKTPYFHKIASELVDLFFAKYGQESLATLIEDMGVNEQIVVHELVNVLGPILDHAARTGFLEQRLRAQLEPFYRSGAVEAALRAEAQ